MANQEVQMNIEMQFNRKLIQERVTAEVNSISNILDIRDVLAQRIEEFSNTKFSYDSKNERMAKLRQMDAKELAMTLLERMAIYTEPELLSSVIGQNGGILGWDNRLDAAKTLSELLAVLSPLGAFTLYKETLASSIKLVSYIPLSNTLKSDIAKGMYLPPMVCEPDELKTNRDSGYKTHSESLILNNNHHDKELCLDVLNTMNRVPLSLNLELLASVPEEPSFAIQTKDQLIAWERFLEQSRNIYTMLATHGNRFYLTHRPDKRGRIYASGYHINSQGVSYKKAMLDLADKEKVEVPTDFFN